MPADTTEPVPADTEYVDRGRQVQMAGRVHVHVDPVGRQRDFGNVPGEGPREAVVTGHLHLPARFLHRGSAIARAVALARGQR